MRFYARLSRWARYWPLSVVLNYCHYYYYYNYLELLVQLSLLLVKLSLLEDQFWKKLFFCVGEYAEYGFDQESWYGMFVACGI